MESVVLFIWVVFYVCVSPSGTEKVRQAQGCKHLHVVNPEWLWACLERWERVEEQLFPLKEDYNKSHRYLSLAVSFSSLLSVCPAFLYPLSSLVPFSIKIVKTAFCFVGIFCRVIVLFTRWIATLMNRMTKPWQEIFQLVLNYKIELHKNHSHFVPNAHDFPLCNTKGDT